MITVDAAMQTLYEQLCTSEYKPTASYTISDYRDNPLLKTQVNQFVKDSTFTVASIQQGPAAEALTRS
jgi:hypothetical protein